jgi:hypothetical protein
VAVRQHGDGRGRNGGEDVKIYIEFEEHEDIGFESPIQKMKYKSIGMTHEDHASSFIIDLLKIYVCDNVQVIIDVVELSLDQHEMEDLIRRTRGLIKSTKNANRRNRITKK